MVDEKAIRSFVAKVPELEIMHSLVTERSKLKQDLWWLEMGVLLESELAMTKKETGKEIMRIEKEIEQILKEQKCL
jgi:hypothetical protein